MTTLNAKTVSRTASTEQALIQQAKEIISGLDIKIKDASEQNRTSITSTISYIIPVHGLDLRRIQLYVYYYIVKAYTTAGFTVELDVRNEDRETYITIGWPSTFTDDGERQKNEFLRKHAVKRS